MFLPHWLEYSPGWTSNLNLEVGVYMHVSCCLFLCVSDNTVLCPGCNLLHN